jgi:ABC-2 type transport system ATP-binding protein
MSAPAVEAIGLTKDYLAPVKEPGFTGALKSLVNRKWRSTRAVDAVDLRIEAGELVGFLGVNGAGKTTTLKMLSGLLTPTGGTAQVLGHVPWKREPSFQRRISLVMGQRSQLWWEIPAQETFRLNQAIFGIPDAEYAKTIGELVELLDLSECLSVPVKKLSLGQRMRCELAAALLHRPALLLLDEPTLGLDVVMQKKVRVFVREYNQRTGSTIVLTSHNMADVVALCPRVVIIERGKLLYDGALTELVKKYADHKTISVVFEKEAASAELETFGRVVSHGDGKAVVEVARKDVSRAAAGLLQRFAVADLTIEETSIDDIVRRIFTHQ